MLFLMDQMTSLTCQEGANRWTCRLHIPWPTYCGLDEGEDDDNDEDNDNDDDVDDDNMMTLVTMTTTTRQQRQ